jgi:hypothetical protein
MVSCRTASLGSDLVTQSATRWLDLLTRSVGISGAFIDGNTITGDREEAFDTIWNDALIYKMSIKDYLVYLLKLTRSFLTGRDFSLYYHGLVSQTHQIPAGLSQWATMSPTLYGILTSDPPELNDCEMAVLPMTRLFSVRTELFHFMED